MHLPGSSPASMPLPPAWASVLAAALLTVWAWPVQTIDMDAFLLPWLAHIRAHGIVGAFAVPFSNYMPPYLYLLALASPLASTVAPASVIKLVSVAGTGALVIALRHLFARLPVSDPNRAAAVFLLVPGVMANATVLHQAEAWWAAPVVMALAAAIDRRHAAMLAWCGVAIAIKAQAAFAAPFFLALLIARRVPLRLWPIAPAAVTALLLPAVVAGWPVSDLAGVYLRQTGHFAQLSLNAPNVWMIVQAMPMIGALPLAGLALAAAAGAAAWYVAFFSVRLPSLGPVGLVAAAALSSLLLVGLLPRMHERFFFLADVLVVALVLARGATWKTGACAQGASCLAIMAYLSGVEALAVVGAAAMMFATWRLLQPFVCAAANDNPVVARPRVLSPG